AGDMEHRYPRALEARDEQKRLILQFDARRERHVELDDRLISVGEDNVGLPERSYRCDRWRATARAKVDYKGDPRGEERRPRTSPANRRNRREYEAIARFRQQALAPRGKRERVAGCGEQQAVNSARLHQPYEGALIERAMDTGEPAQAVEREAEAEW